VGRRGLPAPRGKPAQRDRGARRRQRSRLREGAHPGPLASYHWGGMTVIQAGVAGGTRVGHKDRRGTTTLTMGGCLAGPGAPA